MEKKHGNKKVTLITRQELTAIRLLAEKLKEISKNEALVQMTNERYGKLKKEVFEEMEKKVANA